jgi:hypothetical protein
MAKICLLTAAEFDEWKSNRKFPRCEGHQHEESDVAAAKRLGKGWRRVGKNVLVRVATEPDEKTQDDAVAPFAWRWNRVSGGAGIEKGLRC